MSTEARRLASQANGRLSKGPKTKEGKERSRQNALKHGLTARVVVPPDDREALEERIAIWTHAANPADEIEDYLLERAAWASVRLDRCARKEMAAVRKRRLKAIKTLEHDHDRGLRMATQRLEHLPASAVAELKASAEGCRRLLDLWRPLCESLETRGFFSDDEESTVLRLFGINIQKPIEPESIAAQLRSAMSQARQAPHTSNPARAERLQQMANAARFKLVQMLVTEIQSISQRIEPLEQEHQRLRAEAEELALFDDSPAAQLQRRYETACTSELYRALGELSKRQKLRLAREAAQPEIEFDETPEAEAKPEPEPETPQPPPARLPSTHFETGVAVTASNPLATEPLDQALDDTRRAAEITREVHPAGLRNEPRFAESQVATNVQNGTSVNDSRERPVGSPGRTPSPTPSTAPRPPDPVPEPNLALAG